MHPKVRRDLAYFGQPHLEKPRPNSGRGKVRESSAETLLRQSYPIRGEAAAENKPLVPIVRHDDAPPCLSRGTAPDVAS